MGRAEKSFWQSVDDAACVNAGRRTGVSILLPDAAPRDLPDVVPGCLYLSSGWPFSSLVGLLWLALVTNQKLGVFDRAQFVALAGFDFGEGLFRSPGGNFNQGLFCLNALDGDVG